MFRYRAALLAAVLALCILFVSVSHAQRITPSIDVSGTSVWYADSMRSAGSSLSPAIRVDWPRATLNAYANVARLEHGNLSGQATIAPSMFTPSAGMMTGEIAATLGGSTHQDGTHTGEMLALARAHVIGSNLGAWLGVGAGRTWDGDEWRNVRQGEAGAWLARDDVTTLVTVTPVSVQDTIRYTDLQGALRYPFGSLELGLTAGTRTGKVSPAIGGTSRSWGSVSLVSRVTPVLAVVGSAGTYPVDLTQGFPGGRFVSIALRLMPRSPRVAEQVATALASPSVASTDASGFELRALGGQQRELRVFAPSARRVEINGDFTRWQPVALTRGNNGWWSVARAIAPGTYQMNVRIDGGAWIPPAGLLTTKDEFGGSTGLLTIQ